MSKINSRTKGKRGELELSKELSRLFGCRARRGQQRSGVDQADVIDALPGVHIECKRVERLDLAAAMDQAERDAMPADTPVVMHRVNRGKWQVAFRIRDLPTLALKVMEAVDSELTVEPNADALVHVALDDLLTLAASAADKER